MRKILLSLLVVAASGAYVLDQAWTAPGDDPLSASLLVPPTPRIESADPGGTASGPALLYRPTSETPPAMPAVPVPIPSALALAPTPRPAPTAMAPVPMPRPTRPLIPATVTRAVMTIAANAGFADGTYAGPAVDAYYGLVQIQATVQGGRLIGIKVLQYPSDRRTSVAINRQALPMLRDEAVAAQSANVDIISGATLTSEAFIRSLDGALRQAK